MSGTRKLVDQVADENGWRVTHVEIWHGTEELVQYVRGWKHDAQTVMVVFDQHNGIRRASTTTSGPAAGSRRITGQHKAEQVIAELKRTPLAPPNPALAYDPAEDIGKTFSALTFTHM